MLLLYAIVIGVLVGLALGGHVDSLAGARLRWIPVAVLGFAIQIAIFSGPGSEVVGAAGPPLYVASTVLVLVVVLRNARITGLAVAALGAALNLAAILANGGTMPADPDALIAAGRDAAPGGYSNSAVLANPALRPLTDIFATPRELPFANVFSIGDVLIAVGIAVAIAALMRRRTQSPVTPPAPLAPPPR